MNCVGKSLFLRSNTFSKKHEKGNRFGFVDTTVNAIMTAKTQERRAVGGKVKANIQKTINQLTPSERSKLEKAIFDRLDDELCDAQFIWIKMACAVLNNVGLSEDEILQFLGGWKLMYRRNARIIDKKEQTAFLDAEMEKIFGERGFPEEFMISLREIGR